MEELKPCPFCGGEAELHTEYSNANRPLRFEISCQNFDCRAKITFNVGIKGPREPKGKGLEQLSRNYSLRCERYRHWCDNERSRAIAAWNRRAGEKAEKALEGMNNG